MPTETDLKLVEDLADFRLETERRFGGIEKALEGIQTELRFIRWIGVFFAGILVAVVLGAGGIIWGAATINADVKQHGRALETLTLDVKHQGERLDKVEKRLDAIDAKLEHQVERLDKVEKRLDAIDAKLDVLIRRGEPKAKAE